MAALCGSSNALENLKKRTSLDRTLQQDKVRPQGTLSTPQSFRNSPYLVYGQGQGQADHEFETFSGIPQDPHLLEQHVTVVTRSPASSLPGWASEFQKLSLNNTQSVHFHPPPHPSSSFGEKWRMKPATSSLDWHTQFLQHTNKPIPSHTLAFSPTHAQPYQGLFGNHQQFAMPTPSSPPTQWLENPTHEPVRATSNFSKKKKQDHASEAAAFELAFQEAYTKWQMEGQHDGLDTISTIFSHEEHVIKNGIEQEEEKKKDRSSEKDADELARTAGQLFDSLSGNRDQKFQQSTFLSLMRKLRDKEVKVEGDKMVEVATGWSG